MVETILIGREPIATHLDFQLVFSTQNYRYDKNNAQ